MRSHSPNYPVLPVSRRPCGRSPPFSCPFSVDPTPFHFFLPFPPSPSIFSRNRIWYILNGLKIWHIVPLVATIILTVSNHLTYCQRLARLQLESLELRRLRLDLIFTYKLVFGLIYVDASDFFKLRCDDRNRGHQYKLFLPGYRSSVRQHFLSYRAVHTWNNLPADSRPILAFQIYAVLNADSIHRL